MGKGGEYMQTKMRVFGNILNPNSQSLLSEPVNGDETSITKTNDGSGSTFSIKDEGVAYNKLSQQVKDKVNIWEYDDPESPSKISSKLAIEKNMGDSIVSDIKYLDMNKTHSAPAYTEGIIFYDKDEKSMAFYNDNSQMKVLPSRENIIRVYNNSAVEIADGKVVYPNGVFGGVPTIALANANTTNKSRIVGITTTSVPAYDYGYVCKFGEVSGIDTSSYSEGDFIYLSTVDGEFTATEPTGGAYLVQLGAVLIADTSGKIIVDIVTSLSTVETNNINGFSPQQFSNTDISFNQTTREFTISAVEYPYHYYQNGIKYEKYAEETVTIPDEEGLFVVYYDGETLSYKKNATEAEKLLLIRDKCLISYIYWDATSKAYNYFAEERHGIYMSGDTHANLHFTRGCQLLYGLGLSSFVLGNGNNDVDAQFATADGAILDEDLRTVIPANLSTIGLPVYYFSGDSYSRRKSLSGFSVLTDVAAGTGSTGRLVYNLNTGGVWSIATVPDKGFVLYHVFAINGKDGEDKMISVMGQSIYDKVADARQGANQEISSLISSLVEEEKVPIGTIIYEVRNTYSNAVKARIVTTDTGDTYVDWRVTELSSGASPTSHDNLSEVRNVGVGVSKGHLSDIAETIYGDKTFANGISIPYTTVTLPIGDTIMDTSTSEISTYSYKAQRGTGIIIGNLVTITDQLTNEVYHTNNILLSTGDISSFDFSVVHSAGGRIVSCTTTAVGWTISYQINKLIGGI